jgi:hypothetical protein
MENELQNYSEDTELQSPSDAGTAENEVSEDPSYLQPSENVWVSSDGGTTNVSDPEQGVPYDFCITITNTGEMDSGAFVVKFVLSGDQDPALDLFTDKLDSLAPGGNVLAVYHYGAFENKFGVYHVQAIVCTPDGNTELSADQGFDFTINSE